MVSTVQYFRPQDPAEGEEYDAFLRMLPQLRTSHLWEYVAIYGGEVVAGGVHLDPVLREATRFADGRAVYCGRVEPEGHVCFIGGFTVLADASTFDGPNQVAELH